LSDSNPPESIQIFRKRIEESAGVIFCTPEYIFSIPSGLKNAIEWCVATVVFSDKPTGIIVASGLGDKGFDELKLIMKTVTAKFNDDTTLLISGIKGKVNQQGDITHEATKQQVSKFVESFASLVKTGVSESSI
jgi:NAD(P)H-dependent FMN reductase